MKKFLKYLSFGNDKNLWDLAIMYEINTYTQHKWCKKLGCNPEYRVVNTIYLSVHEFFKARC